MQDSSLTVKSNCIFIWQLSRVDVIALQVLIDKLSDTPLSVFQTHPEVWIDYVDQCKLLMERILDFGRYDVSDEAVTECRLDFAIYCDLIKTIKLFKLESIKNLRTYLHYRFFESFRLKIQNCGLKAKHV